MEWKSLFKDNILKGGMDYVERGSISNLKCIDTAIYADVEGLEVFKVRIVKGADKIVDMSCTCPFACVGNKCKHMAAVLLMAEKEGYLSDKKCANTLEDTQKPGCSQSAGAIGASLGRRIIEEILEAERTEKETNRIPENISEETIEPITVENTDVEEVSPDILSTGDKPVDSVVDEVKVEETEIEETAPVDIMPPTLLVEDGQETFVPSDDISVNHRDDVEFTAHVNLAFMYALYHNHQSLIDHIIVTNNSHEFLTNLRIVISDKNGFFEKTVIQLEDIAAGNTYKLSDPELIADAEKIAALTERISCTLTISLLAGNEEISSIVNNVWIYAYNQWPGDAVYTPDLLVTFVMPNHPIISNILLAASKYLEKWTGSPAFQGYQLQDSGRMDESKNRVLMMAAAIYAAIQEQNIIYSEPPASFYDISEGNLGQRIRFADEILDDKFATCMDITLLYAACLEAVGLHPLLVLIKGHIFAGLWVVNDMFPDIWADDSSQLKKRIADGVSEIIVVECTQMCAGKSVSFDDARSAAEVHLNNPDEFEYVIDVSRARVGKRNIRPLPARIKGEHGFVIQHELRNESEITAAPQSAGSSFDFSQIYNGNETVVTKQVQWERKLLDLSLRNMLINTRFSSIVPIFVGEDSLGELEDHLSDGQEYEILEKLTEWKLYEFNLKMVYELANDLKEFDEVIEKEIKHHRLHSLLSEAELKKYLTKIYRTARTSTEENGASTLYMTVGMLRWSDSSKSKKAAPHLAPLMLLPVNLKMKAGNRGYSLSIRDDDAQINITLIEFLKQNFGMEIPGLDPIPRDDHGLDVEKILAIFRHAILNKDGWDIAPIVCIGNFAFSQFVMWNDLHSRAEELEKNKIVNALISGVVDWENNVPKDVEAQDAYLPVSVDASQLRAINMAANDVSFVLHGPPGTGKSQTITAMIANALAKGKTVLFVAEKMAALNVVQKRLEALGIGDFCLELHSNKAVKKNILEKLKRTIDITVWGMKTDYDQQIEKLHQKREALDTYVKSLHKEQYYGISVRDALDQYETIPDNGVFLRFSREFLESIRKDSFSEHRKLIEAYIENLSLIGDPKKHPFYGVQKTEYSQSLKFNVEEKTDLLYRAIREIKGILREFIGYTDIDTPISESEWKYLQEIIDGISNPVDIPEFVLNTSDTDALFNRLIAYVAAKQQYTEISKKVNSLWTDEFISGDISKYKALYISAQNEIEDKRCELAKIPYVDSFDCEKIYEIVCDETFSIETIKEKKNAFLSLINTLKQDVEEFISYITVPTPVKAKEWIDLQTLYLYLSNPIAIPNMILNASSIDEVFAQPIDYLRKKAEFEEKKAYIDVLWNPSFIAMDMSRYQAKYDEAGKKFIGKKKAYDQLAAELKAFAKFEVIVEQIPLRLAEVIAFKEEQKKFEELSNSLPFEWRAVIEQNPIVEKLIEYKEYCRTQIANNKSEIDLVNRLKANNTYELAVKAGEKYNASIAKVMKANDEMGALLKLSAIPCMDDWVGVKIALIKVVEYCIMACETTNKVVDSLAPYSVSKINTETILADLEEVNTLKEIKAKYDEASRDMSDDLLNAVVDYDTVEKLSELINYCQIQLNENGDVIRICSKLKSNGTYDTTVELGQKLISGIKNTDQLCLEIGELIGIKVGITGKDWIADREQYITLIENNLPKIKDWTNYCASVAACRTAGLDEIIERAEGGLATDKLQDVYFKSIYRALAMRTIEKEAALNNFTGISFEQKIKEYKQLEEELISLTKEEMYYKLTHNLPTPYQSPVTSKELAILRKAITSNGRGMSIRSLFDQIPHILTRLCPCMLMSPISVSQYLSTDCDLFDIVVFDEASQLPTCKAVGVLGRGKNAVIVGDPNQMPPTSFFAGNMIDEDSLDIEDLDSILDDCLALGMPSAHLKWHYRSEHESLIAFSNHEYYDDSMLTFPTINDRECRIKLVTVNGCYRRKEGRKNIEEATVVVNEIKRRYESEKLRGKSIGVVTFNIDQQKVIREMLEEECSKDLKFAEWARLDDENSDDNLIVKNLENIQGDERDIIMFSIGFGPDEEGKLSMNFGPLNKDGGWKRLNVAVSRAKSEMIIFSSMNPEMIDTSRTKAKGVWGLRAFLEYAKTGVMLSESYNVSKNACKGIANKIASEIENAGYTVSKNLGHSAFKIDIAVVNPYDDEEYLMGILLDGDSYKQAERTKDREVSQLEVLESHGWYIHRVWTLDWWDNSEKEMEKIFKQLEECRMVAEIRGKHEKDEGPQSEVIAPLSEREKKPKGPGRKKDPFSEGGGISEHDRFRSKEIIVETTEEK